MDPREIKIAFMGTPRFAEKALKEIIAEKYNVVAVFTQPDKKFGRYQELKKSPVKELAEKNKIPVFEPQNLERGDAKDKLTKLKPDLIIVAAYGKILPRGILEIPKYGAINVHASLLPKYRGASPIQGAIISGEEKTGITLMLMNEKLDAGAIINQEEIAIKKNDNALTLSEKLADMAGKILVETLPLWISGAIKATLQNEKEATYCRVVKKEDGKINWKEPAEEIFRKWKAYIFWPGIFTYFCENKHPRLLKLIEIEEAPATDAGEKAGEVIEYKKQIAVQTGKGLIILKKIQLEGKRATEGISFSRGKQHFIGSCLT